MEKTDKTETEICIPINYETWRTFFWIFRMMDKGDIFDGVMSADWIDYAYDVMQNVVEGMKAKIEADPELDKKVYPHLASTDNEQD